MGVGADSTQKAFGARDITAFFARPPIKIFRDFYEVCKDFRTLTTQPCAHVNNVFPQTNDRENTNHVVVAVDPAGGGSSQFAIASLCQLPNGSIAVRGSCTRPHCCSGQLPSRVPGHISDRITHSCTKLSGAWHEFCKNRGTTKGSTRSAMSFE